MNEHLRRFKRVLAQTKDTFGVRFPGQTDFFLETGANPLPSELVARSIVYFCLEEGLYNGFEAGLAVALQFLYETMSRSPAGGEKAVQDELLKLMEDGVTYKQLLNWASQYYESSEGKRKSINR